ncbi:hypothetical protein LDC_1709 [sediment metagenome]|uniref:Carbamoyltransferase domain-containing protein n=1 Tax=sediment metagenome TaxID=749907 RepID=D9PJJ8_9ZZZZ
MDIGGAVLYTETSSIARGKDPVSVNILGISAYYHDSAACLVTDGRIVAAAQEERFTRKKQTRRFRPTPSSTRSQQAESASPTWTSSPSTTSR